MYRFPILTEKKARALQEGKWRAISNPLYQGNTFLDEEAYPDEEDIQYVRYIMEVYPYLDWPIGPDSPHYQGTRILVYTQFENVKIPRYLIWIDKLASGEVVFAYEISDVIMVISPLSTVVQTDILSEVYQLSGHPRENNTRS